MSYLHPILAFEWSYFLLMLCFHRSSRMNISWIPQFILFLIHHGILGLQKHSRRGLIIIFSKITMCWSGWRGMGGSVGFCARDALIMHVIADMIRKTEFYFIWCWFIHTLFVAKELIFPKGIFFLTYLWLLVSHPLLELFDPMPVSIYPFLYVSW